MAGAAGCGRRVNPRSLGAASTQSEPAVIVFMPGLSPDGAAVAVHSFSRPRTARLVGVHGARRARLHDVDDLSSMIGYVRSDLSIGRRAHAGSARCGTATRGLRRRLFCTMRGALNAMDRRRFLSLSALGLGAIALPHRSSASIGGSPLWSDALRADEAWSAVFARMPAVLAARVDDPQHAVQLRWVRIVRDADGMRRHVVHDRGLMPRRWFPAASVAKLPMALLMA